MVEGSKPKAVGRPRRRLGLLLRTHLRPDLLAPRLSLAPCARPRRRQRNMSVTEGALQELNGVLGAQNDGIRGRMAGKPPWVPEPLAYRSSRVLEEYQIMVLPMPVTAVALKCSAGQLGRAAVASMQVGSTLQSEDRIPWSARAFGATSKTAIRSTKSTAFVPGRRF